MSILRKLQQRKARRQARVRYQLKQTSTLPRISVFRSLQQIYAQLIDDSNHVTLASCSSLELAGGKSKKNKSGDKKTLAHEVGVELAKRSMNKGVKEAVFDRGSYLYHGRVKALADGLREGGLKV